MKTGYFRKFRINSDGVSILIIDQKMPNKEAIFGPKCTVFLQFSLTQNLYPHFVTARSKNELFWV